MQNSSFENHVAMETYFVLDSTKGIQNLLETGVFITNLRGEKVIVSDPISEGELCPPPPQPPHTNLQENSHHGKSVGFARRLAEVGVFGVPVHQMELRKQVQRFNNSHQKYFKGRGKKNPRLTSGGAQYGFFWGGGRGGNSVNWHK